MIADLCRLRPEAVRVIRIDSDGDFSAEAIPSFGEAPRSGQQSNIEAPALAYPVEVQSCFDKVTFDRPPKRPVVNDLTWSRPSLIWV
jgi:hypothetical protein